MRTIPLLPSLSCFLITLAIPAIALANSPDAAAVGSLGAIVIAAALAIGMTFRDIARKKEEERVVHPLWQALKGLGRFVLILLPLWFTLTPLLYVLLE